MSILFINGSPNKEGNTAALAEVLLSGKEYEICGNGNEPFRGGQIIRETMKTL